jgi:hypothetical protein
VFTELYDSTKTAAQQIPSKNRFSFKGQYQSSVSSDIPLNAINVPEGAVVVTAGGIKLTEGVDYTVDYNLGRVKILNTGILESNAPIKISIESNSVFGFQARSLMGMHYNFKLNDQFNFGATWMRMMERPVTQKVDIGSEPFKNNVIGFDFAYRTDVPFLTKLVDLLPVISTTQKSTFSLSGEFAHFQFVGKHEGIEVIFDAVMGTLRLNHSSLVFEEAETRMKKAYPNYVEIDKRKPNHKLDEDLELMLEEIIEELEEEEVIKVSEFVEVETDFEYGIGLDVSLNVEEITHEVITKFISDFNAGTLELDPTLYSFTSEEEEE